MSYTLQRTAMLCLVSILMLCAGFSSQAEPMAAPGDTTKAMQLKLASLPDKPGLWQKHEFSIKNDKEQRFFVRGLNPAAPLSWPTASSSATMKASTGYLNISLKVSTNPITMPISRGTLRLPWRQRVSNWNGQSLHSLPR